MVEQLTLVSYNILANAYINLEWYPGVDPALFEPKQRLEALVAHIRSLDSDVICLQEVEAASFAAIGENLPEYEAHFVKKRGRWKPDGCATLFRKVKLVDETALYFSDAHKGKPSGHVAQILRFEWQGKQLAIANTHLKWDAPGTPKERQIGLRQARQLIQYLREHPADGWILCGDLNAEPGTPPITALLDAGFAMAYSKTTPHTCNINQRPQQIDYILVSEALVWSAHPLRALSPDTPLPSGEEPSDHLALTAQVGWRPFP